LTAVDRGSRAGQSSLVLALADGREVLDLPMYYDGGWSHAVDGRLFDSRNPATGEVWARVAEAGPEDIDRAVAAARHAFESSWSTTRAADRAAVEDRGDR
jgi:Aldehyde dehydrogenase family